MDSGLRRTSRLWRVLFLVATISGCANQAPRSYGTCGVGGAVLGALVGAGAGLAIEYNDKSHPSSDNRAAAGGGGAQLEP